jgi:trehalose 6-phosphate synthase
VVFVALAYPTRQGLPEYLAYQNEVESTVERINERWATRDWTPIVLDVEDDYDRSLAALTRYDVLLVNPVRDGLNLVALEGPLVNRRHGVLALSREAGAFDELGEVSLALNPFDISATAATLGRALDFGPDERVAMAEALVARIRARSPADWLDDQLAAAR